MLSRGGNVLFHVVGHDAVMVIFDVCCGFFVVDVCGLALLALLRSGK